MNLEEAAQSYSRNQNKRSSNSNSNSIVWLTGVRCSPTRLPLAIVLTVAKKRCCAKMALPPKSQDLIVLGILIGSILGVYVTLGAVQWVVGTDPNVRHWLVNLMVNCLGYSLSLIHI